MSVNKWMYRVIVSLAIVALAMPAFAQQQRGQRGGQQGGERGQRPAPVVTEGSVSAISAGSITIKTADGSKTIALPEMVRVSQTITLDKSSLKAGTAVSLQQRRTDEGRSIVLSLVPEGMAQRGGQNQQGGRRGGRGGGNVLTVKSTSPLTLQSPDGETRDIPANASVSVVRMERAEVSDISQGTNVQVREFTSPRGKMVMVNIIK